MRLFKTVGVLSLGVVVIAVIAGVPTVAISLIAKEGCPDRCGNLSIPYPFGLTPSCCYNNDFIINCTYTGEAFLLRDNVPVSYISLDSGELEVMQDIAYDCYNSSGYKYAQSTPSIWFSKFWISTKNKFTATGCDTNSYIRFSYGNGNVSSGSGCVSVCNSLDNITVGSCLGIGCCQTSIPRGMRSFNVFLISYNSHANITDFNPCSYAFVIQEKKFNFSLKSLTDSLKGQKVPFVIDWAIGNLTCEQAKISSNHTYACMDHLSECVDNEYGLGYGYRCNCSTGYKGNPYLPGGCQNIDECNDPDLNRCEENTLCHDTDGSYECLCLKGHRGDGRKGGEGCTRDLSPGVLVAICIGSGLGGLFLILGTWRLWIIVKKRQEVKLKRKYFKRNGGLLLQQQPLPSAEKGYVEKTKLFSSEEIEKATDNYNENRILGRGGQGTVYKGMLTDRKIVAVKKSKTVDESQLEEFINEVRILSQINHRYVVKLHGCCLETEVPLLVYEFIANGTLFEYIHDERNDDFPLSWDVRLRIASEVAGAIAYLHSAASVPIYHRDIKSSNILLDDKYRVKVADFGTSRSVPIDQTHKTTKKVRGTFGYFDPEYFQSSKFTAKSDVYSFGVVLLELLTGQKPILPIMAEEGQGLVSYFISSIEEDRLFDILDARVVSEGGKEEISAVANLARKCLNFSGIKRPTMQQVAMELEAIRTLMLTAALPPMEVHYDSEGEVFDDCNIKELSISTLDTASNTPSIEEKSLMSN